MKRKSRNSIIAIVASIMAATTMTACDALWDTSMDYDPGYYGVGINADWDPTLPGAPLLSPIYWGNQLYPGGILPPVGGFGPARPYPGGIAGNRPIINRPTGNVRPAPSIPATPLQPSQPSNPSGSIAVPDHPIDINGSNPGIQMPPAGTGLRPATGRH